MQKIGLTHGEFALPSRITGGKYYVTSYGRVFRSPCKARPSWNEVTGEVTAFGYRRVNLSIDGKPKKFYVHRLVADEFVGKIGLKPFVNHIDGNKLNNHVDNLEWCTASENERHSYDVLGKVGNKTKPEWVRLGVIKARQAGKKLREIAEDFGVSIRYVKYATSAH